MDILAEVNKIEELIIEWRRYFHQHPEVGMKEFETSKKIQEVLKEWDIPFELIEPTGVVGIIGDNTKKKTIALRADMDGLPMAENTQVVYRSVYENRMHACGHDGHMAALLGAGVILKKYEKELPFRVKLLFQPSEENCKGAKKIFSSGVLRDVSEIYGGHIFTDLPSGMLSIEKGERMASTAIFNIRLHGKGGHAGKPHQCIDTTLAASAMVMNLQSIVSRNINPVESAVVTVGSLHSGSSYNIISSDATLEGTIRYFSSDVEEQIRESLERVIDGTAKTYGCSVKLNYIPSAHPAVINDEKLTKKALKAAKRVFLDEQFISVPKMMLGEDFSVFLQNIPGVFAFFGGGNSKKGYVFPNHHECFNFDESAVMDMTKFFVACSTENELFGA